ncbi:aldehyde dehydrogenase family protein [Amycolatopsis nigrescens]|uniref:aldehyde dehydrogenase family protein n=1 Tax=Amycolatopsis nigrescens TaxID=381445 RepID=UPI00039EC869|nr:aldehyde dehydrogenase family protein [Amycolatopsis nigrescens]
MSAPSTVAKVRTVNPVHGEEIATYPVTSERALTALLDAAAVRRTESPGERAALLRTMAARLRAGSPEFAFLITTEMGKPLGQAAAEIEKSAAACEYYAEHVERLVAPRPVDVAPDSGFVRPLPLGALLAIMPWNYPFWQVFRAMIPAVAIGNTVVLKHADNVTGSAYAVQALFDEVFGPGVLSTVVLPPHRIGKLIEDPRIAGVAFTGSNRVGAIVGARAGAVVKKTVLELGGSDPFVVLADADVGAAARAAVRSRFLNAGQSCIAAKRLIVAQLVRDEFVDAALAELDALVVGDPLSPGTDLGPMARVDLRDELRRQLGAGLSSGARLLGGGEPDQGPGAWFTPTLVEVPDTGNPLFQDETFGPLGALLAVPAEADAIAAANASRYGLSCSIWSRDVERAQALTAKIDAGSVFVNRISESDPRIPVGGVKASGHGRELGTHGALEFANLQSVRTA